MKKRLFTFGELCFAKEMFAFSGLLKLMLPRQQNMLVLVPVKRRML